MASVFVAGCASLQPKASRAEPDSLAQDVLVARVAMEERDNREAMSRWMAIMAASPEDVEAAQIALEQALLAGDSARAVFAATEAQKRGLASAQVGLTLAARALAQGRAKDAQTALAGLQPTRMDVLATDILRAWVLAAEGQTDAALAAFDARVPPGTPLARVFMHQRAMLLAHGGRTEEALAAFKAAEDGPLRLAPTVLANGALLERLGRKDEALAIYDSWTSRLDNAALTRARARLLAGQAPPPAVTAAEGAALAMFSIAVTLTGEADPDFYAPYLTLALLLAPDMQEVRLSFAGIWQERGQPDYAQAVLQQVPNSSPYALTARVDEAWILRRQEKKSEALALADAAVVVAGDARGPRESLAALYRTLEQWEQAEKLLNALIAETPNPKQRHWRLWYARGQTLHRQDRWPAAEADLKRALELSPDEADVLNYLGYTWVDRGENLDQGIAYIRKALETEPDAGHIVDSLGWAYFRLGQFDNAVMHLERAFALEPASWEVADHLGDAYWRVDRRVDARNLWSRALKLEAPVDKVAGIEAKLEHGLPALPKTPPSIAAPDATKNRRK